MPISQACFSSHSSFSFSTTTNTLALAPPSQSLLAMKFFAIAAALASLVPWILSELTVNTPPSITYCQPQRIIWTGGQAPYYPTIIPGGEIGAAPLKTFDTQDGDQLTWMVDIAAGNSVTFSIKDASGNQAYSDKVMIQPGSTTTCNFNSTGTGSTVSTTFASGTGSTTSSSKALGSGTGSATATTTTSKSTATQTSSSSRASHRTASSYLAALMGLIALL